MQTAHATCISASLAEGSNWARDDSEFKLLKVYTCTDVYSWSRWSSWS